AITAMDVTQTGVAIGRYDAERHQRLGVFRRHFKCRGDGFLELIDRFDDMIGGHHRTYRIRIALLQNGGCVTNGICRIPTDRFTQNIIRGQLRKIGLDQGHMARRRANEDLRSRQDPAQTLVADLQKTLAVDEAQQLLGFVPARNWPKTSPRSPRHDYAVLHKSPNYNTTPGFNLVAGKTFNLRRTFVNSRNVQLAVFFPPTVSSATAPGPAVPSPPPAPLRPPIANPDTRISSHPNRADLPPAGASAFCPTYPWTLQSPRR